MSITPAVASLRFGAMAMILACGLAASPSFAQVRPPEEGYHKAPNADYGPGLPNFDSRTDAEGIPLARVTSHVDVLKKTPAWTAREADAARLRATVDGVAIDDDPLMGTARFVRSTWKFLTPPKTAGDKWTPIGVVKDFMTAYPDLMEGAAAEIDGARVERDFLTDHNGARHLTYQQQIRGVDLLEAEVRANVTRNGELINLQNTMLPRPAGDFVTPAIKFDGRAAIIIATANVGVQLSADPVAATEPAGPNMRQEWAKHPDLRPDETIITELVYFAIDRDTIHPAWHVVVPVKGVGHTYDIYVDAADGTILYRKDWLVWDSTQPVTMNIYVSDGIAPGSPGTATPTGFQFPVVPRQLITWNPSDVTPFSPNGWINDGNTQTVGNNVDAHTDINNDNQPDLPRPDGGASRVFNFPFDPAVDPATQQQASVVELFYRANWYHDKLMVLGFNEAAGNFQTTNFSGHGVGGDAYICDAQDGSGTNNSNFSTDGIDGDSGRCQMYIFTGPTPHRDGSFDGDIVYHELTHGTSIRLHHGLLNNTQSGGMGEGWSDFVALSLLAESTDDPDAVYCTGGYTTYLLNSTASFNTNYYFGIRRFPYTTDLTKAPQTYADIAVAQLNFAATIPHSPVISAVAANAAEVHSIGEVWCEMLNDCRASLWHTYGFAGNQRMLQIVIDGMKLDPQNPSLIQARDAIIAADNADYAGVDGLALWTAFARRGLGFSATSPGGSGSTVGIVEAYDIPPAVTFAFPDGLPSQLLPGTSTTFRVNVAATVVGTPVPGTGQMYVSVNGAPYTTVALTQVTPNQYTATIPPQSCFALVSYYFSSGSSLGVRTSPTTAPAAVDHATVYSSTTNLVSDSFETDTGWTVGPNTATTGLWVRSDPVGVLTNGTSGTLVQPEDAHSGAGTLCWVTGNAAVGAANGTQDVDNGYTTLLSPVYNLSAYADATVSYWRWYSNATGNLPNSNTFRVDVSTNGGTTWTNAETVGPSGAQTNPGWFQGSWSLVGLGLTPTANVRIRFIAEDLTGSVVEAAVDDFRIDVPACTATTTGACCTAPAGSCTVEAQSACTGAGTTYQGDSTSCTPVSPCAPTNESITITKSGSGHGTVSSNAGGINCGPTCSGSVPFGTSLTLSAAPDAQSVFAGWIGGACSGTGDCVQTVSGPIAVTAQFRCKSDFNSDGSTSVGDIFDFLAAWFAGAPAADFNGTNGITVQDIFDFLAAWFVGCP